MTTTLSQRHTLLAVERVQAVHRQCNATDRKEYRTLMLALAPMILQHGLAQTGSFYLAKGRGAHLRVWADLAAVVQENGSIDDAAARAWFEREVLRAECARYQWLTRRALSAATALKRQVQALLPAED